MEDHGNKPRASGYDADKDHPDIRDEGDNEHDGHQGCQHGCLHDHLGEDEKELTIDNDLFEQLVGYLPPHLRSSDIPREVQIDYLTKFLSKFRKRKQEETLALEMYKKYKEAVTNNFVSYDKDLYNINKWVFVAAFREAIESGSEEHMRSLLTEVHPGIYAFNMLEPDFCDRLLEEIKFFENWCIRRGLKVHRPNTMNNYGAILDDFGFETPLNQLMQQYIAPFAAFLYPYIDNSFDTHHGFVVSYELGKDVNLAFHVDESDVTLNVCLGKEFTGGDLYFGGVRCAFHQQTAPRPDEEFYFAHQRGWAILHVGKHRHLAKDIKSGERHNLIMWCRSSAFADKVEKVYENNECPPWCKFD